MVRWWWFGPAVDRQELKREMLQMTQAGFGGFEVQPVYPLTLDDPARGLRNIAYLSPEFLNLLAFAAEKAREFGLRMDLTLGSGWPYGGPNVSPGSAAAMLSYRHIPVKPGTREAPPPALAPGERLLAAFAVDGTGAKRRSLSLMNGHGGALPDAGLTADSILYFSVRRTGMKVKRAAAGAEGPVMNHYSRAALDEYLATTGAPLLKALSAHPPYSIFCDSFEVLGSDWTDDLPTEFHERRGYDLTPHLPALVEDAGPTTGAVRNDWGLTLAELAEERFLSPLLDWARQHGTRLRAQVYGIPPYSLSSNRLVDLPEGEGSAWDRFSTSRWAASAAHLDGQPVVSSETWTWLHSPAFRATPLDMKAEADRHFLQGINQLIGHGWPYSPKAAGEPGWRFYAAGAFNPHNPWWPVMPDLNRYLQRVSFLLRQGKPVNDVALYLPVSDARASFTAGHTSLSEALEARFEQGTVIRQILAAGFNFDFIDDAFLDHPAPTEGGALTVGANRFRVVVLPDVERIPLQTYRKLEAFARSGGVLLAAGGVPRLAPGLLEAVATSDDIRRISRRLFDGPKPPAHRVSAGDGSLTKVLAQRLRPDFSLRPAAQGIGFVHRRTDTAEIYFIANTTNIAQRTAATFRVQDLAPEWWDPDTGRVSPAHIENRTSGVTVPLDLEPYGSRILVFRAGQPRTAPRGDRTPTPPRTIELGGKWKVAFADLGRSVEFDTLRSWTDDAETRFYSGQATYEKTFAIEGNQLRPGVAWFLSFGEGKRVPEVPQNQPGMRAWLDSPVREAAVVAVNGRRAGSVWRPPYRVEVTGLLRPGSNKLEVTVGNLAINRLAGEPAPDYAPLDRRYGKRFEPQDMDNLRPLPSGLLAPVLLVSAPEGSHIAPEPPRNAGSAILLPPMARRKAAEGSTIVRRSASEKE